MGNKKYQIIYADPPYPIKWTNSNTVSGFKKLEYPTMGIAEMCHLPIKKIMDDGCKCFVWTTNGFLIETIYMIKQWGFQYDKIWTWCKKTGAGGHPRNATEHIVEGTAGFIKTIGMHESATNNWFIASRGKHSEKPEEPRQMIERFYPNSQKIELFARKKFIGWDAWGNEIENDIDLMSLQDDNIIQPKLF
jgi:N6-adenosine-specific RNA methylase IME4